MTVDKMTHMVGRYDFVSPIRLKLFQLTKQYFNFSYAPKKDLQSYTTPLEDAPSGLLYRGHYTVSSLFTDDDQNEHLKWEWSFEIKKDWN